MTYFLLDYVIVLIISNLLNDDLFSIRLYYCIDNYAFTVMISVLLSYVIILIMTLL